MANNITEPYDPYGVPIEMREMQQAWGWLLALGIALLVLGIVAIAFPNYAAFETLNLPAVFGWLLVCAGFIHALVAVSGSKKLGGWMSVAFTFLLAIVMVVAGAWLILVPLKGALTLTVFLSFYFFTEGIVRIASSLDDATPSVHRRWQIFSGALSIVLGWLLWSGWPSTAPWAVGVVLGVDFIICGFVFLVASVAIKELKNQRVAAPVTGKFVH